MAAAACSSRSERSASRPTPAALNTPAALFSGIDAGNTSTRAFRGWWVVTRLTERHRRLRVDGVPARIDFTVTLTKHADRSAGAADAD